MKPVCITIHCADTPNGVFYDIEKIRAFHKAPPPAGRGWSDIGYHAVIQPTGEIQNGRALNAVGAHVESHNTVEPDFTTLKSQPTIPHTGLNLGICLIGSGKYTVRQFDALRSFLDSLTQTYSIPKWEIRCHNQYDTAIKQGKTCPAMEINRLIAWYVSGDMKAIAPYLLETA